MAPRPLTRDPEPLVGKVTQEGYQPPARSGQCCLPAGKTHRSQGESSRAREPGPPSPASPSLPPGSSPSSPPPPPGCRNLSVLQALGSPFLGSCARVPICLAFSFHFHLKALLQGKDDFKFSPFSPWACRRRTWFAKWTGEMVRLSQTQRIGQGGETWNIEAEMGARGWLSIVRKPSSAPSSLPLEKSLPPEPWGCMRIGLMTTFNK